MSDQRKPIDTLRTKNATELALTDYLLGHDEGSPAAFRTPVEEALDFLAPELVPRIIGQVETNANGSYVRFENGLQVCWFQSDTEVPTSGQTVAPWYHTAVTAFTFPAAFVDVPAVMPTSRTASNGLGVTVTGASAGSCSLRGWGVNSGQWVRFGYVAVGRWK